MKPFGSPRPRTPAGQHLAGSAGLPMFSEASPHSHLELLAAGDFSTNDLWLAFVNWMAYFFPDEVMKQQIAEVALRRAQLLN